MLFYKTTNMMYAGVSVYYYVRDGGTDYWVWSDAGSGYVLSTTLGSPRRFNGSGTLYYPQPYLYNGNPVYYGVYSGAGYWFSYIPAYSSAYYFATPVLGYVCPLINGVTPPPPNKWYRAAGSGPSGINGTFYLYGTSNVSTNITFPVAPIVGRSCGTLAGLYTPISGSGLSGNMFVGFRRYTMTFPSTFGYTSAFLCETADLRNSKNIFKFSQIGVGTRYCWYNTNTSKWTISPKEGVIDTLIGYWTKSVTSGEPDGSYSLTYTGPIGSTPVPATYTITGSPPGITETLPFDSSVAKVDALISQVALWLPYG